MSTIGGMAFRNQATGSGQRIFDAASAAKPNSFGALEGSRQRARLAVRPRGIRLDGWRRAGALVDCRGQVADGEARTEPTSTGAFVVASVRLGGVVGDEQASRAALPFARP